MINAFSYEGAQAGPHVLMLAGVHGDERPGVVALDRLISSLNMGEVSLVRGKLTIIPRVNAAAVAKSRPFIDESLNRIVCWTDNPVTHEQKLAAALLPYLDAADAVLDLHATPIPTAPFVFLDDDRPVTLEWADALGLDYILIGGPSLYDVTHDATIGAYVAERGCPVLTAQIGELTDHDAATAGYLAAINTLAHFGLRPLAGQVKKPRHLKLTHLVFRQQDGAFLKSWKNFEYVRAGTLIARYEDGTALTCDHNGYVVMPNPAAGRGEEWFYLAAALDAPGRRSPGSPA